MLPGAGEVGASRPVLLTATLEPARTQDAPAIKRLLEDCGLPVEDLSAVSRFLVARNGSALCGTIGFEAFGDTGLLRSLAVSREARNKGLGRYLCEQILADAGKSGVKGVYLLTTDAQKFFRRVGFKEVARATAPAAIQASRQFRSLCPASATLMSREL